jgi:hypothetical protein
MREGLVALRLLLRLSCATVSDSNAGVQCRITVNGACTLTRLVAGLIVSDNDREEVLLLPAVADDIDLCNAR